jgi:hypothetical protein
MQLVRLGKARLNSGGTCLPLDKYLEDKGCHAVALGLLNLAAPPFPSGIGHLVNVSRNARVLVAA